LVAPNLKENLYDEFLKYGRISTIRIDGEGDKKACYISFKHSDQAQAACETLNDKLFMQQTIIRVEKFDLNHSQTSNTSLNSIHVNNNSAATSSSGSSSSTGSASTGSNIVNSNSNSNSNTNAVNYNTSNSSAGIAKMTTSDEDLDEYSLRATRTLYIGNLDRDVKHCDLREKLDKKYGDIIEIEIKKDNKKQQSNSSNSYAFIQFSDIRSVIKAMRCMNGK
jgi:RNA recognition motif-containing protein